MDEDEAAEKIRSTFDQVEIWHRTPLFLPNVGSQLRADDDAWPYMSISQLSKVGLDVAAEHLHVSRLLIQAGELFPFAHRSLLRTASLVRPRPCGCSLPTTAPSGPAATES